MKGRKSGHCHFSVTEFTEIEEVKKMRSKGKGLTIGLLGLAVLGGVMGTLMFFFFSGEALAGHCTDISVGRDTVINCLLDNDRFGQAIDTATGLPITAAACTAGGGVSLGGMCFNSASNTGAQGFNPVLLLRNETLDAVFSTQVGGTSTGNMFGKVVDFITGVGSTATLDGSTTTAHFIDPDLGDRAFDPCVQGQTIPNVPVGCGAATTPNTAPSFKINPGMSIADAGFTMAFNTLAGDGFQFLAPGTAPVAGDPCLGAAPPGLNHVCMNFSLTQVTPGAGGGQVLAAPGDQFFTASASFEFDTDPVTGLPVGGLNTVEVATSQTICQPATVAADCGTPGVFTQSMSLPFLYNNPATTFAVQGNSSYPSGTSQAVGGVVTSTALDNTAGTSTVGTCFPGVPGGCAAPTP